MFNLSKTRPCQSFEGFRSRRDLQAVPMQAVQHSDVSEAVPSLWCRPRHAVNRAWPVRTVLWDGYVTHTLVRTRRAWDRCREWVAPL